MSRHARRLQITVAGTGHEALGYAVEDLTNAGGMITTSYDGQIIEGMHGTSLRIAHSNVTVRGCRFDGGSTYGAYYNPTMGSTYTNNVVEYCTFAAVGDQDTNAMLFQSAEGSPTRNLTLRYNNCHHPTALVLVRTALGATFGYHSLLTTPAALLLISLILRLFMNLSTRQRISGCMAARRSKAAPYQHLIPAASIARELFIIFVLINRLGNFTVWL